MYYVPWIRCEAVSISLTLQAPTQTHTQPASSCHAPARWHYIKAFDVLQYFCSSAFYYHYNGRPTCARVSLCDSAQLLTGSFYLTEWIEVGYHPPTDVVAFALTPRLQPSWWNGFGSSPAKANGLQLNWCNERPEGVELVWGCSFPRSWSAKSVVFFVTQHSCNLIV